MNVRKLFLSGALVALTGFMTIGCNENPSDPTVGSVSGLAASSMTATSVKLVWNPVTGATSYAVAWTPIGNPTGVAGSVSVTGTEAIATNLTAETEYTFTVTPNDATGAGTASSIRWAGASRHGTTSAQTIRMYEKDSQQPSGLNLNVGGAPQMVSLSVGTPGPQAQLAMYIYQRAGQANPDSIIVGPVYALTEYKVSSGNDFSRMDTALGISATTFQVASLDTWYLSTSLDGMIVARSNVMAYTFKPATPGGTIAGGHGFIVRTGVPGNYNFARVVIKNLNGKMLGGTGVNEYVEVEISYQDKENLAFAKPGARPAPIGVRAMVQGQ